MKLFALILAGAVAISAIPLEARVGKRPKISHIPGKSINCGGQDACANIYPVSVIKSATLASWLPMRDVPGRATTGANRYPHVYGYCDAHCTSLTPSASTVTSPMNSAS